MIVTSLNWKTFVMNELNADYNYDPNEIFYFNYNSKWNSSHINDVIPYLDKSCVTDHLMCTLSDPFSIRYFEMVDYNRFLAKLFYMKWYEWINLWFKTDLINLQEAVLNFVRSNKIYSYSMFLINFNVKYTDFKSLIDKCLIPYDECDFVRKLIRHKDEFYNSFYMHYLNMDYCVLDKIVNGFQDMTIVCST